MSARQEASEGALEQVLQVCEQGMSATDEAPSDTRGVGVLAGKREGGGGLAHQHVRHSLWGQGSLGTHNELLIGCLDDEVEALQQRKAQHGEARGLSEGRVPAGATQAVAQAARQGSRWALSHIANTCCG